METGMILLPATYLAGLVFVVVFALRVWRMAASPVHFRWELSPVPHEKGRDSYGGSYLEEFEWWTKKREKSLMNELVAMGQEIFLLKGVWENNRPLWWFSFPFHIGLYVLTVEAPVILLAGILFALEIGTGLLPLLENLIVILTFSGCLLGLIGALGLLHTRLTIPKYRNFTAPAGFFNLILLAAVFLTGIVGAAFTDFYGTEASRFAASVITFSGDYTVSTLPTVHILFALLFLAYLPFTQMMHFAAKYFLYHKVRWDDEPMRGNDRMAEEVTRMLSQPVSWAAPHVGADGKKNWVDLATSDPGKAEEKKEEKKESNEENKS